jgi:hypothetical protein
MSADPDHGSRKTVEVSPELFRQVYDSPNSLPGKDQWVTPDEDVRRLEQLLGMNVGTIGAPLWVSADNRNCESCERTVSWLDIVASALADVHSAAKIAEVILGDRKWVNVEAPEAIAGVRCFECGTPKTDVRSFKCHNWAYAIGDLEAVVREVARRAESHPPR